MNLPLLAELLVAGLALGLLGGLLGIGGGIFAIPLLALWFGLDQQHAQGTALVMVVPNVAVGLWSYARRGKMDKRLGLSLALAAFPLTYLGARIAVVVPSAPLRIAFAIFIASIGVLIAARAIRPASATAPPRKPVPWPFAIVVGVLGGLLSGLFGVGGAVFAVPLVAFLFVLPQAAAQGFGLALVAPGTLVGITTYALAGDVNWAMGVPLAIGGVVSVPFGVKLAHRLPERRLKLIFAALIMLAAVALVARSSAGAAGLERRPNAPAQLLFADDFNGSSLNTDVWYRCFPWSDETTGCSNGPPYDLEWYLAANATVAHGQLNLSALHETVGRYSYSSGMIESGPSPAHGPGFAFLYGYTEM